MIRNFSSTPNVMGRLILVLLFAGGVVFAGAFDGFVVETKASSCCGGGMDDAIFSSSSNDDCTCLNGNACSYCSSPPSNGCGTNYCPGGCGCNSTCCDTDCKKAGKPCEGKKSDGTCKSA